MMTNVNKTLYIPLYGKALVSRKGIILTDKKAEKIWEKEGFPLKGKSRSKWLAYYMAMRAAVFDNWLKNEMAHDSSASVLHIGCGMDSRIERVGCGGHKWYDIDFPEVIELRKKYYTQTENYTMTAGDVRNADWLSVIPAGTNAIVVFEGVSMYLTQYELKCFMQALAEHFSAVKLLMDCYTERGVAATKIKNPINDVGVNSVYGIDEPEILETVPGLSFLREHDMTPQNMINELKGAERICFKTMFGGRFAKSIYRIYEFEKR